MKKQTRPVEPLKLENVIDMLCSYNFENSDFYLADRLNTKGEHYFGFCDDEIKKIFVNKKLSTEEKRKTIIHEFYHAYLTSLGIKDNESYVKKCTNDLYKKLYDK